MLAQSGFTALQPFPLLTIPLFVLAGRLMEIGGMADHLIENRHQHWSVPTRAAWAWSR